MPKRKNQVGHGLDLTHIGRPAVLDPEDGQHAWALSTPFSITYSDGSLTTAVGSPPAVTVAKTVGAIYSLNYLEITLGKNQTGSSVAFQDLKLGDQQLGTFELGSTGRGTAHWHVTGIELSGGFELSGTLVLSSPLIALGTDDASFAQIALGSVAPDPDAPVVSNIQVVPSPALLP